MPSAPHPDTYKAYAFLEKGGDLKPIDVTWRDPQSGEIVVKVLACGVCARHVLVVLEASLYLNCFFPFRDVPSCPGSRDHRRRRRYTGDREDLEGRTTRRRRLARWALLDMLWLSGRQFPPVLLPTAVASVPEDIDPAEVAPLMCAGVSVYTALRDMNAHAPDVIGIHGMGGLGHLAVQFAKAMGFRPVVLSSTSEKEELAFKFGAYKFLDGSKVNQAEELAKLGGAKVILCLAPDDNVVQSLVNGLAPGGEFFILAVSQGGTVPLGLFVGKRLNLRTGGAGTAKEEEETIDFVRAHDIKVLVNKFPLAEAQKAYEHRSAARFRSVIIP
ncbi:predicted protein [Postia placenta Mad-698-R]|nr:predicted protein [Postia placenta Mad-698-R]